jgi:hypothetical protein
MYSVPVAASVGAAAASTQSNAATAAETEQYLLGKEVKLKDVDTTKQGGIFEIVRTRSLSFVISMHGSPVHSQHLFMLT